MKVKVLNLLMVMLVLVLLANVLLPQLLSASADTDTSGSGSGTEEVVPPEDIPGKDEDKEDPQPDKTFKYKTASDVVSAFNTYINGEGSYKSAVSGTIVTKGTNITQNVYGTEQRDAMGKVYRYNASVKNGLIGKTFANEVYMDNRGQTYYRETDKVDSSNKGVFANKYTAYTNKSFISQRHVNPGKLDYIITTATIKSMGEYKLGAKTVSAVIELNPITATERYAGIVKNMSGSASAPTFSSIKITIIIDYFGQPVELKILEDYNIKLFGMSHRIIGSVTKSYNSVGKYFSITTPQGV